MDTFAHIRILIGMVMSLSIALMLKGTVKMVQHPGRDKPYWIHLLWALYVFLLLIHFWWWEFTFHNFSKWTFALYAFLICYIIVFYVMSALLFPDDLRDYTGYENYFYSRKKWFFLVLGFSFVMDIIDTSLKGKEYAGHLGIEYPMRNILHLILCIIAIRVSNKKFHAALVLFFLLYEISFILRAYYSQYA